MSAVGDARELTLPAKTSHQASPLNAGESSRRGDLLCDA